MNKNKFTIKKVIIAGSVLAGTYSAMKAVANSRVEPKEIDGGNPYIKVGEVETRQQTVYESKVKPTLDRILSFAGLVLFSPLYAGIAAAIYIDDPGPVFFTQKRVGKDKRFFQLHKFRSMKISTPHDVPTHQLEQPEQYITRVGRVLRKTSLDEFPQIWDIFRGKMSVIGPRPALWNQDDLVMEREKYGANGILPGLTGLAQIKGRDELEISDKARIDGEYTSVLRRGGMKAIWQDIACFMGTIVSVVRHDGVVEGGTGSSERGVINSSDNFQTAHTSEGVAVPTDAGFDEYGFKKKFYIDKTIYKKVLVTGAQSYIGESFEKWVAECYPNIEVTTIDMVDGSWRNYDFSGFDTVFHVAGIAHVDVVKVTDEEKKRYYAVNTDLAIKTAQAAKTAGVRQFIFMSSMIVYGDSASYGKKKVIDEHTVPVPTNFYGDSKWRADVGVRRFASETFRVAVLRPPMIYGKGSKGNYPVLSKWAKRLPVFPDVDNERSMLYIDNLCEFVSLLVLSGEGGVYFPQNGEYAKTSEMVKKIGAVTGKGIFVTRLFNPVVGIISHIPGKTSGLLNKAFGNAIYEKKLSTYKGLDYQLVDLNTSVACTEGVSIIKPLADEPKVSIITAAYNCAGTIGETMESVIAQTYQNWEMLIVDDASTDNTADIVESYVERDNRIKLISHTVNSGAAEARNTAIENALGRYIAIIDSDDLWKKQKLERQIAFMVQNGYAFTFTSYETFHNSTDKVRRLFKVPYSINYNQYLRNTVIGNLTVVIDKEQINDLHIKSGCLEDVLTWMYLLRKGYIAYGLDENLASYRVDIRSKSGNKMKNAKRYYKCLRNVQMLSLPECILDEACYIFNATKKRVFGKTIIYI